MEYLFVDYNRFTGQFPREVTNLATLIELHMGYNRKLLSTDGFGVRSHSSCSNLTNHELFSS